ncbi:MAG: XdhC family protein [Gammaproteobacteria bacterium]|nr:XdhC family protein [Gammaproteobacteria bacterium]
MTPTQMLECFDRWRADGQPMTLAVVYDTEGSTYSKAGAQMLINGDGDFRGMLSGGCLEGDLAERARQVIASGQCQCVTYDLAHDDEELWGLGVGCDGLMRIFLMPLTADNDYQPFAAIARALAGDTDEVAASVIETNGTRLAVGAGFVTDGAGLAWQSGADAAIDSLLPEALAAREAGLSQRATIRLAGESASVLFSLLRPAPRILVLGGGLDAGPVVRFAAELGWRITVQDHRPAYLEKADFSLAEQVHCLPPDSLAEKVKLARYSAAIVMSHHLGSDRAYLRQLAATPISYIGLLGPRHRRKRLLDELGAEGHALAGRVHGPAGLDLGGSGPASIALSIVAQMHAHIVAASRPAIPD